MPVANAVAVSLAGDLGGIHVRPDATLPADPHFFSVGGQDTRAS
jgi:hypothetical protein